MSQATRERQMRQQLAQEAARIMAESGTRDFQAAKRKAAQHLGVPDTRQLPRNREIEEALVAYQRLFRHQTQPRQLQRLREAACEAMALLAEFEPRLVGSVLSGTADRGAVVELHVFADTPEQVQLFLMARGIPFQHQARRVQMQRGVHSSLPGYAFVAGDIPVALTVFPPGGQRQAPLSAVDGRPMRRASRQAVLDLLAADRDAVNPPPAGDG